MHAFCSGKENPSTILGPKRHLHEGCQLSYCDNQLSNRDNRHKVLQSHQVVVHDFGRGASDQEYEQYAVEDAVGVQLSQSFAAQWHSDTE